MLPLLFSLLSLNSGVTPMTGIDPYLPNDDLAIVGQKTQGAKLIAIGESAHGSGGFHLVRWRLARYLIETQGVRVIFLENPMRSAQAAHLYVKDGSGSLKTAVGALSPDYADREFAGFIGWLRQFNDSHPGDPVSFDGIDLWDYPWEDLKIVEDFVAPFANDALNGLFAEARQSCYAFKLNSLDEYVHSDEYKNWLRDKKFPDEQYEACMASLRALKSEFEAHRDVWTAQSSSDLYFTAWVRLRALLHWEENSNFLLRDFVHAEGLRDRLLSEQVMDFWSYEGSGKKALLLAHNVHVGKDSSEIFAPPASDWGAWKGIRSAGEYLKDRLADAYKVIGVTGYEVHSSRGDYVLPSGDESLDLALDQLNEPYLLVDPSGTFVGARQQWWMQAENSPQNPNGYRLNPSRNYDLIVFLRKANAPSIDK